MTEEENTIHRLKLPLHHEGRQQQEVVNNGGTFHIGQEEECSDDSFFRTTFSEDEDDSHTSSPPLSEIKSFSTENHENCSLPNAVMLLPKCKTVHNSISNLSSATLHRSVSWSKEVVTEIKIIPKTKSCELRELYYSKTDKKRLKLEKKWKEYQKKIQHNTKKYSKQSQSKKRIILNDDSNHCNISRKSKSLKSSTSHDQHHPQQFYTSPISGLVKTLIYHFSGSPQQILSTTKPKSCPTSRFRDSNHVSNRVGSIAEAYILVDTLYLF